MADITIRNLNYDVEARMRVRAADIGRSMEEEARLILPDAFGRRPSSRSFGSIGCSHFDPTNCSGLALLRRRDGRAPARTGEAVQIDTMAVVPKDGSGTIRQSAS